MSALVESAYFGILMTAAAYCAATAVQKKTGLVICNNLLISALLIGAVLTAFHIPYDAYYQGGSVINSLLGPATACLAVNIYQKRELLKQYWLPVLAGCTAGALSWLCWASRARKRSNCGSLMLTPGSFSSVITFCERSISFRLVRTSPGTDRYSRGTFSR